MRGNRVRIFALATAAVLTLVVGAPAATAAPMHDAVNFKVPCVEFGFTSYDCEPSFRVAEGEGAASVDIERGTHGKEPATVDFDTTGLTATAGTDFTDSDTTVPMPYGIGEYDVSVPILDDANAPEPNVEEPIEYVDLDLNNASSGTIVAFPDSAYLTIIDDDGEQRFSFEFGQ